MIYSNEYKRSSKNKSHPFANAADSRIVNLLLEKLDLMVAGYIYIDFVRKKQSKYGWVLTSLPKQLDDLDSLQKLDKYIDFLINHYVSSQEHKEFLSKKKNMD